MDSAVISRNCATTSLRYSSPLRSLTPPTQHRVIGVRETGHNGGRWWKEGIGKLNLDLDIKLKEYKNRGNTEENSTEAVRDGREIRNGVDSKDRSAFFENQADIWLTTEEAASFLRISSKSLLNLTSNGRIRYYKFGRRNRFLLKELHMVLLAKPRGGIYGN